MHDAVLVHRESILFANARFLGLLGATVGQVVGRPLSEFVAPEYVDLVEQNLRAAFALADRHHVMSKGQIHVTATTAGIENDETILKTYLSV